MRFGLRTCTCWRPLPVRLSHPPHRWFRQIPRIYSRSIDSVRHGGWCWLSRCSFLLSPLFRLLCFLRSYLFSTQWRSESSSIRRNGIGYSRAAVKVDVFGRGSESIGVFEGSEGPGRMFCRGAGGSCAFASQGILGGQYS